MKDGHVKVRFHELICMSRLASSWPRSVEPSFQIPNHIQKPPKSREFAYLEVTRNQAFSQPDCVTFATDDRNPEPLHILLELFSD